MDPDRIESNMPPPSPDEGRRFSRAMLLARRPVLAGTSFKSIKQIVAGVFMQLIAEIHRMQHQPFIAGPDVVSEGR
jgi:hypothetical protein